MINSVTSRDNRILKMMRSLHKKKGREQHGLYFAEGVRLVNEALGFVQDSVKFVLAAASYADKNAGFIDRLDSDGKIVYIIDDKLFNEICDTETPQGIAAAIEIPQTEIPDFSDMEYVLILDGVSEPGNMGTIIRTAEAAGIECICLINGCTDVYGSKVVRSSMGSVFRMKFLNCDLRITEKLKHCGFTVAATALYNSHPIEEADICGKRAIVIGNEARGVSSEVLALADLSLRIDMCGSAESLNAAVAAGISMYMLRPKRGI